LLDLLYFAAIFLPSFGALFGLRLAYLRGAINTLQQRADSFTDETYNNFVAIIFSTTRDPTEVLNLAAQYFSWKDIQRQLVKFYRNNKYHEYIDIAGIISSIILIIIKVSYDIFWLEIVFTLEAMFFTAIILIIVSSVSFLKSYIKLNGLEGRLGIGKAQSTH
jgi:hypothetical protein